MSTSAPTAPTKFVEVPFSCRIPSVCPICCLPGEKNIKMEACEGVPGVLVLSVAINIAYCRTHHRQVKFYLLRQRLAIAGAIAAPFGALLPALVYPSLSWLFFLGLACSPLFIYHSVLDGKRLRASRGVDMRTQGNQRYYLLRAFNEEWHKQLLYLIGEHQKNRIEPNRVVTGMDMPI